jgi:hypothetical protein
LTYQSNTETEINFSDFDESSFVLNSDDLVDGTDIKIDIDGYI